MARKPGKHRAAMFVLVADPSLWIMSSCASCHQGHCQAWGLGLAPGRASHSRIPGLLHDSAAGCCAHNAETCVSTAPAGLSAEPLSPPAPSAFDATTPAAAAPAVGPAAPPAASALAPGDAAPPAGLAAVGQRVAVWCPGDGSFYRCALSDSPPCQNRETLILPKAAPGG